jgi:hypothetical protein
MCKYKCKYKCTGKTANDCHECNKYYVWYSLRYDCSYKKKIEEFICSIGGNRTFNEDGNEI